MENMIFGLFIGVMLTAWLCFYGTSFQILSAKGEIVEDAITTSALAACQFDSDYFALYHEAAILDYDQVLNDFVEIFSVNLSLENFDGKAWHSGTGTIFDLTNGRMVELESFIIVNIFENNHAKDHYAVYNINSGTWTVTYQNTETGPIIIDGQTVTGTSIYAAIKAPFKSFMGKTGTAIKADLIGCNIY